MTGMLRPAVRRLLGWGLLLLVVFGARPAQAHLPHDVINAVAMSPDFANDQTAFLVTHVGWLTTTELLRTQDGGDTWHEVWQGLDNRDWLYTVAISPDFAIDRTVLAAGNDGSFVSYDGGDSWQRGNSRFKIRTLRFAADYAGGGVVYALSGTRQLLRSYNNATSWLEIATNTTALTTFRAADDTVWLVRGDNTGGLHFSDDEGETWQTFSGGWPVSNAAITALGAYNGCDSVLVGDANGALLTVDAGDLTVAATSALTVNTRITSIALHSDCATALAVGERAASWKTSDGGASWQPRPDGLTTTPQAAQRGQPDFNMVALSDAFAADQTAMVSGFDGIFRTTDGGATWWQLEVQHIRYPMGVIQDPQEPGRLMVATLHAGNVIRDGSGGVWQTANNRIQQVAMEDINAAVNAEGETVVTVAAWAAFYQAGIDGEWNRSPIDSRLYRVEPSPAYADDETLFISGSLIVGSYDDAGVYKQVGTGSPPQRIWGDASDEVHGIAVSPAYADDQTLYAGVWRKGVYRSQDGGATWEDISDPLMAHSTGVLPVKTDLAISPNFANDNVVFAVTANGLFRSDDRGDNWTLVYNTDRDNYGAVTAVAVSPDFAQDGRVVMSVKGRGMWHSLDGGISFVPIPSPRSAEVPAARRLTYQPYTGGQIALYSLGELLYVSYDHGQSWALVDYPLRYEDWWDSIHVYSGDWTLKVIDSRYSAISAATTQTAGSSVTFNFVGNCVALLGASGPGNGQARITLDGVDVATVDQYAPQVGSQLTQYRSPNLADGMHRITLTALGTADPAASGTRIEFDAFDVGQGANCNQVALAVGGVAAAASDTPPGTPLLLAALMLLALVGVLIRRRTT